MRMTAPRTRHLFALTLACIAIYILAVQKFGLETVQVIPNDSAFVRIWDWFAFVSSDYNFPTNSMSSRHYTRAQSKCRDNAMFIPRHEELRTNSSWMYEWGDDTLHKQAVYFNISTTDTLRMKPIPYLENFKNPCWLEKLQNSYPYFGKDHQFQFAPSNFQVDPALQMTRLFHSRIAAGKPYRLRCLPYYFIIGPQKTGTTDLFEKMNYHPFLRRGRLKEPHFWPRSKNEKNITLSEYADLFDEAAERIASTSVKCDKKKPNFYPLITGEGTAETMWDNWFWRDTPENQGFDEIKFLTAHHIRHVIPQARIIAILRDPTDRLYSDFTYFNHPYPKTAEVFHSLVKEGISNMTFCLYESTQGRKPCIYNRMGRGRPIGNIWNPAVRLRMGLYSEYLQDWFDIFPTEQILLINFDDYVANRTTVLNTVFKFLELEPLSPHLANALANLAVENSNQQHTIYNEKMFRETEILLKRFYKPFNKKLSVQSRNKDFLIWNEIT